MPTTILSDRYQCVIVYSAVTIEHYCIFINVCSFQLDGLFDFDFSDALPCFFVVIFNAFIFVESAFAGITVHRRALYFCA